VLGAFAQAEGEAIEGHAGDPAAGSLQEDLAEGRHAAERGRAEDVRVDRHIAPAEDFEVFFLGDLFETLARLGGLGLIGREEGEAGCKSAGDGKVEVDDSPQESVGDLDQDARAVAGVGFGSDRATVIEITQSGEAFGNDVVAGHTGQRGNERDTTGIVFVLRVIQTLCGRLCLLGAQLFGPFSRRQWRLFRTGDDIGPSQPLKITRWLSVFRETGHRRRCPPGR